jgi:hypothetical protein
MAQQKLEKKVAFAYSFAEASKESIAMAMIALGVKLISEGETVIGGFLVTVGWFLLIINKMWERE